MTNSDNPARFETYRPGSGPPAPRSSGAQGGGGGSRPGGPPRKPGSRPGAPRRGSGAAGGGSLGAIVLYGFLGVLALAAAGLGALVAFPPTDLIREQAIAQVRAATGRELKIEGPASLTFFPALGVTLDKVSLSAPPAMGGAPLVAMDRLRVAVQVMPLLSRQVVVDHLVLTQPVFNLRADRAGRKSWDFAELGPAVAPLRFAQAGSQTQTDAPVLVPQGARGYFEDPAAGTPSSGGAPRQVAALEGVALGDVRIENGRLSYADEASGARQTLESMNLRLASKALTGPLDVDGDVGWKGQKIGLAATLASMRDLIDKRPTKLRAGLTAAPLKAAFDGTFDPAGATLLDGTMSGEARSVRAMARWLGAELPKAKGFGPATVAGRLALASGRISLTGADITFDGAKASGVITVTTASVRPHVRADLKMDQLDLNLYTSGGGGGRGDAPRTTDGAEAGPPPARKAAPAGTAPGSIDDLLKSDGPKVKGYTQRAGWSNETIDVAALGAADADLKLALGRLLVQDLKFGRTSLTVGLKDSVLRTSVHEMQLYEGKASGLLTLDGSARAPALAANLQIDGVSAQPLLRDAAAIDWLSGNGRLVMVLASRGASERQIVEALDGTASFTFTNGALVGFNIPQAIRSLSQGKISNLSAAPTQKTDFSQLSASFKITAGVAESTDLAMSSPLLRLTGAGRVMLPPREVDYTIRPKLVADLAGQGGKSGLAGLEIPIRVHGPWERVKYTPDLAAVLKDPGQAVEAVKQLGEQLKSGKAKQVLDELKGKKPQEVLDGLLKDGEVGGQKVDTKKLLDGLLGGR
ncbi:MAG: AsmA family protein [Hyphomicrobiaceae bacterium]|nr:AsmA family protein [Hyphomicrobiaceae bacterium]